MYSRAFLPATFQYLETILFPEEQDNRAISSSWQSDSRTVARSNVTNASWILPQELSGVSSIDSCKAPTSPGILLVSFTAHLFSTWDFRAAHQAIAPEHQNKAIWNFFDNLSGLWKTWNNNSAPCGSSLIKSTLLNNESFIGFGHIVKECNARLLENLYREISYDLRLIW